MVEVCTFDENDECLEMIHTDCVKVNYKDQNVRVYYPNGDFQNIAYKELISSYMVTGSNLMVIKVRV